VFVIAGYNINAEHSLCMEFLDVSTEDVMVTGDFFGQFQPRSTTHMANIMLRSAFFLNNGEKVLHKLPHNFCKNIAYVSLRQEIQEKFSV
jgi:hypothetical protein